MDGRGGNKVLCCCRIFVSLPPCRHGALLFSYSGMCVVPLSLLLRGSIDGNTQEGEGATLRMGETYPPTPHLLSPKPQSEFVATSGDKVVSSSPNLHDISHPLCIRQGVGLKKFHHGETSFFPFWMSGRGALHVYGDLFMSAV